MANEDTQQLLDKIKLDAIDNQTPAAAMIPTRNDARAMLMKFYSQHPFVPITPIMRGIMVVLAANTPFEFNIPDGTIGLFITGQQTAALGAIYGSWDGIATPIASLAAGANPGYFPITAGGRGYFVYGKKQLQVVSTGAAAVWIEAYMGEDGLIG